MIPSMFVSARSTGRLRFHLDGNYLQSAIAAAKYAKTNGVKVSLDAGGLYPSIETLLPYADILIPSAEFAKGITGKAEIPEAMAALAEKYCPEILAVTDGSNGGYYWNGEKAVHYASVQVKAIDSNGAAIPSTARFSRRTAAVKAWKNVADSQARSPRINVRTRARERIR